MSQFHQESEQYYNELPYCELISSKIIEWDEAIDREPLPDTAPFNEGVFFTVEEKMVLDIQLKVLQNQQVRVTSTSNDDKDDEPRQDDFKKNADGDVYHLDLKFDD